MGEEVKMEPHAEEKKEEKTEEEEPKPPAPLILSLDLHCPGCAKKIKGSIMKIKAGVEGVVTDMAQNQVIIKGVVDPQAVCAKIMKRIKRTAKILSPLPSAEGEPLPEIVTSQVSEVTTVELGVNMHCAACAEQLKKKILRMRGVQTATTELSIGKVTVTGTMDANKLVEYVYRRTKKQAKIVPQPEPEPKPKPEPEKKDEVKPAEEENKQENNEETTKEEEKPVETIEETKKEEGENKEAEGQEKKEENAEGGGESKEEPPKKEEEEEEENSANPAEPDHHEQNRQRMIHYYQPVYVIERIPPPQIFSDENPNACCIS